MIVVDDDVATCVWFASLLLFFSLLNMIGCGFDSSNYKMLMHFDRLTLFFFFSQKGIWFTRGSEIEIRKKQEERIDNYQNKHKLWHL